MVFWKTPQPIKTWANIQKKEEPAHGRWMDLFFDLLYVGVAFLIGHQLEHNFHHHHHSPTQSVWISFQYFFILIGPWFSNLAFYSRFDVNDTVHKLLDVLEYVLVGCAAVFMSSPYNTAFWLAIVSVRVVTFVRYLELSICTTHDNCRAMARYLCGAEVIALLILLLNDSVLEWLVIAQVFQFGHIFVRVWIGSFSPSNAVPLHIGFVTHRVGELMMLMIGESVLSLVTTKMPLNHAEEPLFYASLIAGFLTSVSCMWLSYGSSTFHAQKHVLRNSGRGGVIWMNVVWLHAFVLVVVGVALRMMLTVGKEKPSMEVSYLLCTALACNFCLAQVNEYLHTLNHLSAACAGMPSGMYRSVVVTLEICSVSVLLCLPWMLDEDVSGYTYVLCCGGIVCCQALLELYDPNAHGMEEKRFHLAHHDGDGDDHVVKKD